MNGKKFLVNRNKLLWLALAAFDNAIRLHGDAIYLYKDKRYPSSYALSILAQEEIGKAHMVSNFVWLAGDIDGRLSDAEQAEFLNLLYRHPLKQAAFLRHSHYAFKLMTKEKGQRIYQDIFDGDLEGKKQNATYVGLKRFKGKIDLHGQVQRPENNVSRRKAKAQISTIHDYLIDACGGIIVGTYDFDIPSIEKVLNRRLYKKLRSHWPIASKGVRKSIAAYNKVLKKDKKQPL